MELMTCSEFAGAYNLSLSKVRSMCQTGELPALKIGVGWRINREMAEGVLLDLFNNSSAHRPARARKSRPIKTKAGRKFNFLAELDQAKGRIL